MARVYIWSLFLAVFQGKIGNSDKNYQYLIYKLAEIE